MIDTYRALRTLAAVSTIIAVLSGTGCTSNRQSGQTPTATAHPGGWPATLNDFTVVWTAEPGIDVITSPAVAVRAYTESYLLASITSDGKYLYPGFKQAVDPNQPEGHPTGTQYLWPKTDEPQHPWVGTAQEHILSINTSGRDLTVVTCEYLFGAAAQGRNQGYTPMIAQPPPDSGIYPARITMTAPEPPGPQMDPQRGPARAPSTDVFNGWRITSHQGGYFALSGIGAEWPNHNQDRDACLAKAPQHPDLLRGGEYPRSAFPTQPPSPGWPASSSAS